MPVAPRALALCLLLSLSMLSGCALLDAAINDPDQAPGFDLDEVDMTQDMPDQDAPDLDMAPDLAPDMDMAPDLPPDMPDQDMDMAPDMPDMDPPCQDYPPGQGAQQALAVAVGQDFSCALLTDQTVKCWGSNSYGQLGATQPGRRVTGLCERAVAIGAGAYHACAVLESGKVACWGAGGYGQLGNGMTGQSPNQGAPDNEIYRETRAVSVAAITDAKRVYAGEFYTCVRREDNSVSCWGRNHRRQLGIGSGPDVVIAPTPLDLPMGVTASQLYAGENNACALGSDGDVYCWGRNEYGESGQPPAMVGQNERPAAASPTRVAGLTDPSRVASGSGLACAIALDGAAAGCGVTETVTQCWGGLDKLTGKEDEDVINRTGTPTLQHRTMGAQELYIGSNYVCVLYEDGVAQCWGVNTSFQLGSDVQEPLVTVKLPPEVEIDTTDDTKMDIDANGTHACAISAAGEVYCWGNNAFGKLGRATIPPDQRPFPVKVEGL